MKRLLVAAVLALLFQFGDGRPVFAQGDAFPIASAQIVNSPDVRGWVATASITRLSFDGSTTRVDFTKKNGPNRWPDVTPPNWEGPLQYTLWLYVQVNGQWVGAGFVQFWNGRDGSGSSSDPDVPSIYNKHWYYSERWSPIFGHGQIKSGEPIGFMVTSGNARDSVGPYGPAERSNVVVIPATDNGDFVFAAAPTPVVVPPTPVPPVVVPPVVVVPPTPTPLPSTELQQCLAAINQVGQDVKAGRVENQEFFSNVKSVWAQIGAPLLKYVMPAIAAFVVGKKL